MNKKEFKDHLQEVKKVPQSSKDRDVQKWKKGLPLTKPAVYGHMWNPHKEEEIIQLTDEMITWSMLETSVNINDFPLLHNISPYKFKRIDNDYFQRALETVKFRVASRNRRLVNSKECDKDIYLKELRLYDLEYKEDQDEQIAKKIAGVKASLGNVTIIDHMLEKE